MEVAEFCTGYLGIEEECAVMLAWWSRQSGWMSSILPRRDGAWADLRDGCIGVSYRKSIRCRKDSIFSQEGKKQRSTCREWQTVLLLRMKCGRRSGRGDDPSGSGSALPGCLLQTPIRLACPSLLSLGPATAFLVTHPLPPWARPVYLRRFPLCLTVAQGSLPGTLGLLWVPACASLVTCHSLNRIHCQGAHFCA